MKDEPDVESWVCESCKKKFNDQESKILECEQCEGHHCAHCVRISDVEYEFMTARKDIHWFLRGLRQEDNAGFTQQKGD